MKKAGHDSHSRISLGLNLRRAGSRLLAALAAALLALGWQPPATAQSDNFDDGNDTSPPPAWFHYDPIGGLTAPPASFLFTNGGYRIYAPEPAVDAAGAARAGSFLTGVEYGDFYISADLIDFDDTLRQAFGIAARVGSPGLGTTTGYLFSWEPGGGTLPGTANGDLDISPLAGEQPTGQIETAPSGFHLTRGKSYRFVFIGKGFDFEGQVYELPDTTNALIRLPARDDAMLYTKGLVGLIAADEGNAPLNAADATFDNFLVTDHDPSSFCDSFNDGNDTSPPPPWFHYDPIGGLTADPASYEFTNGGYRIFAPVPQAMDAGFARAGSFLTNATFSDFYVSADLIDFDDTIRQAFGVAARVNTPGLATTTGYLFSWEPGGGSLPGTDNGDLDISPLSAEAPMGQIETAPSGLHLTRGKSYRFVFMGKGFDFEGQVYELPDVANPLIRLPATDPNMLYASGTVGLVVADEGNGDLNQGDATFDNFVAASLEPRLTISRAGNTVTLSWPVFTSYVLQRTSSLSSPVWTEVTTGVTQAAGLSTYAVTGATDTQFYRLICRCN